MNRIDYVSGLPQGEDELSDKHKRYTNFFMDLGTKPIPKKGLSMPKSKIKYLLSDKEIEAFNTDWGKFWASQRLTILAKWCGHSLEIIKTGFALKMDDDFNIGVLGRLYTFVQIVLPKEVNFTLRIKGDYCVIDSDLDVVKFLKDADKERKISSPVSQQMIALQMIVDLSDRFKKEE